MDEIRAVEALVRWAHPGWPAAPVKFIPLAEEAGLMGRLTGWVLDEAVPPMRGLAVVGRTSP